MKWGLLAAAFAVAVSGASAAQALTFNFNWTSSGAPSSGTVTAAGFIEIDVLAGQSFTESDLGAFSILVSGASITDFTLESSNVASPIIAGTISADGMSVSFADLYFSDGTYAFGCNDPSGTCGAVETNSGILHNIISGRTVSGDLPFLSLYSSPEAALASFELTPVPLPASAPMLLAGLGALALWRRKRRAALSAA